MGVYMSVLSIPRQYINCKKVELFKESEEETDSRIVKIIASDETPVIRFSWNKWEEYYLIIDHSKQSLDASRVKNGVCCFFENHPGLFSKSKRIGKVLSYELTEEKQLILTIKLNRSQEASDYLRDVEDGTEPGNSIGFDVHKLEVVEKAIYEESDNGYRKLKKPATMRATKWELLEVSAVDIPANPNTGTYKFDNIPTNPVELIGDSEEKMSGIKEQPEKEADTNSIELQQLKQQVASHENLQKQLTNENGYLKLRSKASAFLLENQITQDQFDKFFGTIDSDLSKIGQMSAQDATIELKVLERSIDMVKKSPQERFDNNKNYLGNTEIQAKNNDNRVVGTSPEHGLGKMNLDETAEFIIQGL